jgi:nicotinamide-nucleotide amidase
MDDELKKLAAQTVARLGEAKKVLVTAESCTGGLIGAVITDVPGASNIYYGGFVTYDNRAKSKMPGVDKKLMEPGGPGAVSAQVARAMAKGALKAGQPQVNIALSVTGVAGPAASEAKPVGLVFIGVATPDGTRYEKHRFAPALGRAGIRVAAAKAALQLVLDTIEGP